MFFFYLLILTTADAEIKLDRFQGQTVSLAGLWGQPGFWAVRTSVQSCHWVEIYHGRCRWAVCTQCSLDDEVITF